MTDIKSTDFVPATPYRLADLVAYAPGSVVSRTIHKSKAGTITLFAFAAGQELSEHSAPFEAWLQVLDGKVKAIIGGKVVRAAAGEIVLLPANIPHGVIAESDFKMMLTMMRG